MDNLKARGLAQYQISQRRIDELTGWLDERFPQITTQLIQGCMDVYAQVTDSLGAGKKSTPTDLFQSDSYWELQKNSKELLQSFGEEVNEQVTATLRLMYIEVYEGCRPGQETFCTVKENIIQQVIHEARGKAARNSQERVWANLTYLWDGLFGQLMHAVIKHLPASKLLINLQTQCNEIERTLKSSFSDGATYVQARAVARRIKDENKKRLENIIAAASVSEDEETTPVPAMFAMARNVMSVSEEDDEWDEDDYEGEMDELDEMAEHVLVQCFSVGDDGSCEPCMDLNEIVWDEDVYGPAPVPVHPNCRCWVEEFENPFLEAADTVAGYGGGFIAMSILVGILAFAGAIYNDYMSGGNSPEDWLSSWGSDYPI